MGIEVVGQEIIPGPPTQNFEVSAYISTKRILFGPFIMKKMRQFPSQFGVGTSGVSVKNERLRHHAQEVFFKMGLKGFINAEFKWDSRRQSYRYIETNPRVWQQIDLATSCGLDLCLVQYQDLTGQEPQRAENYREGIRWVNPIPDYYSFLESRHSNQSSFRQWLQSWKHTKVWGIFSLLDPWPSLWPLLFTRQLPALAWRTFLSLVASSTR
jgi:predicted ATP-grasp superfamily ATP-dependent carboligase